MATAPKIEDISQILKRHLPVQYGAVLFGSRATGRARPGSDWDIGVLGPAALGGAVIETIREELDELPTLHSFDVVDLTTVPEYFRNTALRGAKPVLSASILQIFAREMSLPAKTSINLAAFEVALARLRDVILQPKMELVVDAAMLHFKHVFESAWRTTMRAAHAAGVKCGATPREAIRAAVKAEWIEDNDLWLKMLASRNLTSHAYDRNIAEEIFDRLPEYKGALSGLLERLKLVIEPPEDASEENAVES